MMTPITPSNPPSSKPSVQLRFFDFAIAAPMAAQNSQRSIAVSRLTTAEARAPAGALMLFQLVGFGGLDLNSVVVLARHRRCGPTS